MDSHDVDSVVVSKGPLLSNMSHLGTTNIIVFSGICFGTYFTIQIILIPIYISRNPVYSIPVVPKLCPRLSYHR